MPASVRAASLRQKIAGQRWRLAPLRLRVERTAYARFARPSPRSTGRVLCYHSTGTPEWGVNDVRPSDFEAQMGLARSLGYRFVHLETAAGAESGSRDLAITFDDGLASLLNVVPYLERERIPFAVFPVTEWASNPGARFLSWRQLGELAGRGATIGSHSITHPNFRTLHPDQRLAELHGSREAFERELGLLPTAFAIPFGRRADWGAASTALAHSAGYSFILAQSEDRRPAGTVGRSFVCRHDDGARFRAVLEGRFDAWEEWF